MINNIESIYFFLNKTTNNKYQNNQTKIQDNIMYILKICIYEICNTEELFTMYNLKLKFVAYQNSKKCVMSRNINMYKNLKN